MPSGCPSHIAGCFLKDTGPRDGSLVAGQAPTQSMLFWEVKGVALETELKDTHSYIKEGEGATREALSWWTVQDGVWPEYGAGLVTTGACSHLLPVRGASSGGSCGT